MGKRAETRDELRKESITKIQGQPTDQDITTLEKELIAIAASIPTTSGGGNHGHAGLIVDATKYLTMAGVAFVIPPNPGQQDLQQMQWQEHEPGWEQNTKRK